jgi:hypothetical protein
VIKIKLFLRIFEKNVENFLSPRKKFGWKIFELFLKIVPLYVSDDADHFKPIKKNSIFSKIFENFLRPRKIFKDKFFELFLKMVPLYVSEDADHFKPIKNFSILAN